MATDRDTVSDFVLEELRLSSKLVVIRASD
jgi:hypothetical protein